MEPQRTTSDQKDSTEPQGTTRRYRFPVGNRANPSGRPPQPLVVRRARLLKQKAEKEVIAEFKQRLFDALPEVTEVLVEQALGGNLGAIKEVNERAMGKAIQINQNDNSMTVTFTLLPEERSKIDNLLLHD